MNITKESVYHLIEKVRSGNPLVHNITNYVVMNNTANALLALGASPVMAHALEEVEDMATIAGALVVNVGTLDTKWVASMKKAMKKADQLEKPIVLDPVGAGATSFRNQVINELIQTSHPTVLRGNSSEIIAVYDHSKKTRGVDSSDPSDTALETAGLLNQNLDSVICISGAVDYIVDKGRIAEVHNGHELMAKVTGMGCTSTAIIGAFTAVHSDYFEATTAAMALMGVAGQLAAVSAKGPGTLQLHLLDKLHNITKEEFLDTVKLKINH
ncbi:hydroxyethylthiazole kinase [Fulvivirga sp. M361]|uniref:hydroxyethylthiazole kinase n=1 Tax=Fulvivirga sp. M361 TaxID=2594266 RepID=UPI001C86CE2E|nr:hydroxyethylthiazole kinase [Fulvivirga sp. M361]